MKSYLIALLFMSMCWQTQLYTMHMFSSDCDDTAKTRHRLAMIFMRNIFKKKDGSLSLSNESRITMERMQLSKEATKKAANAQRKKERRQLDKDVGARIIKARQKKGKNKHQRCYK